MPYLNDPNMQEMMLQAFVICLVLTGIHGYLGFHVLARKVIFVDLAMAQIAALGSIYALFLGFPNGSPYVYFFSLGATLIGAFMFSITRMRSERVPHEAIIGIIYACSSAVAILLLAHSPSGGTRIKEMLVGNILSVTWPTILKTTVIYGVIGVFHWYYRDTFFKISRSHEKAREEGIRIRLWDFLFYVSFGVVITSSVKIAGVLLVFSFLVIPATIGILFVDGARSRIWVGWAAGTLVSAVGVLFSFEADQPSGPAVVATFAVVLIICGIVYYIRARDNTFRAIRNVTGGALFFGLLLLGTWNMRTYTAEHVHHEKNTVQKRIATALKSEDPARKMNALSHLAKHPDRKHLPAVRKILTTTSSSSVFEKALVAAASYRHPPPTDALRTASRRKLADPFLLYDLATKTLPAENPFRVWILITVLEMGVRQNEGLLGVQKAVKTLRSVTGRNFGYNVFGDRTEKKQALKKWKRYWKQNGSKLTWHKKKKRFVVRKKSE